MSTSDCGCCEDAMDATPLSEANAPELSTIKYRVGTHGSFKQSMIHGLDRDTDLSGLTTRSDDDLSIGLIDAWATVADALSFYQERIANEGFLRTAKERLSVLQLARAIGYELRPGVAASGYLAFRLDDTGSVQQTKIDVGTKVQSLPIQGQIPPELPQTFETIQSIIALPKFNSIVPKLSVPQVIDSKNIDSLTDVYFKGTDTRLNPGDALLFALSSAKGKTPVALKTVASVTLDAAKGQTHVALYEDPTELDDQSILVSAPSQPSVMPTAPGQSFGAGSLQSVGDINQVDISAVKAIVSQNLTQSALTAMLTERGWDYDQFVDIVNSYAAAFTGTTGTEVYAMRVRTGLFGSTAPNFNTLPPSLTTGPTGTTGTGGTIQNPPAYTDWEGVSVNTDSHGSPYDGGKTIYLSNTYQAVLPKSWAVLRSHDKTAAYWIEDVREESLADFLMSAKVTGLALRVDAFPALSTNVNVSSPGAALYLTLAGFPPNAALTVTYDGLAWAPTPGQIAADSYGNCSIPELVPVSGPQSTEGTHIIRATDGAGNMAYTILTLSAATPSVGVYPAHSDGTITPGGASGVGVMGSGFAPNSKLTLYWDTVTPGAGTEIGADGNGIFNAKTGAPPMQIPGNMTIGNHTLLAVDSGGNILATTVFEMCIQVSLSSMSGAAGTSIVAAAPPGSTGTTGTTGTGTTGTIGTTGTTGTSGTTGTAGTSGTTGTTASGTTGAAPAMMRKLASPDEIESEPESAPFAAPVARLSPGTQQTFSPNTVYSFLFDGTPMGTVTTRSDGSFVVRIMIPKNATTGVHGIEIVDPSGYPVHVFAQSASGEPVPLQFNVTRNLSDFKLRQTTAFVQSEQLELADLADTSPVQGASVTLNSALGGLEPGQAIAVTGHLALQPGQTTSETISEIVWIKDIFPFDQGTPFTRITLADPGLANSYERSTLSINANVALATHGETKTEILGGGDPTQPLLEFSLKQKPLTYVSSSSSPTGAQSTLQVWVGTGPASVRWSEASSLYGLTPDSKSYAVRIDDDGTVNVLFGSARPPAGNENISVKYRVGIGSPGMLQADQLTLLGSRPLGLRSVTNPLPTSGAADFEGIEHARVDAPLEVLTLDRIVSLKDAENFARAFEGIGKALAVWAWDGERKVIRLILASSTQDIVAPPMPLYASLTAAIAKFSDPLIDVRIESFTKKFFNVGGWILVASGRDPDAIQQSVVATLRSTFSFDSRSLGQPVTLSELISTIQRVDGIVANDVDYLYLSTPGQESSNDSLACGISELLILNPDPQGIALEARTQP